jgi:hypothetical protein
VATSSNYYVKVFKEVESEDFPNLSDELVQKFCKIFVKVLATDPYDRLGMQGHNLERELSGCKTFDIWHLGEAYRIVYRIDDRPRENAHTS